MVRAAAVAALGFSLMRFASSSSEFALTSPAFTKEGGEIPEKYTCQGQDVRPPLAWTAPPSGTRSLALIVDDPDAPDPAAPKHTWVHWIVYDLPPAASELAEGAPLPEGAQPGTNDFGQTRWRGPCPPTGRHRYFFKLYALDVRLGDRGPLSKKALEARMVGHMLAGVELVGNYEKVSSP